MRRRGFLAATAIGAIAIAPFYSWARSCSEEIGRTSDSPTGLRVVLIDETTSLRAADVSELSARISRWPRGKDRCVVLTFGGTAPELLRLVFDHAFEPRTLPDVVVADIPTRDTKKYAGCAEDADKKGRENLAAAISASLSHPDVSPQGHSPIFQAIRAVSAVLADEGIQSRSLVLVSDGIQHVHEEGIAASFYEPGHADRVRNFDADSVLGDLTAKGKLPNLARVAVSHLAVGQAAVDFRPNLTQRFHPNLTHPIVAWRS